MPAEGAAGAACRIAVWPPEALAERPRLFASLGAAFDVSFAAFAAVAPVPDAIVVVGDGIAAVPGAGSRPATFAAPARVDGPAAPVHVLDGAPVDRRLRGITLNGRLARQPREIEPGEEVLARGGSGPAWTRHPERRMQRVTAALDELGAGEVLRNVLLYERPLALVALVAFLREVGPTRPAPPPLRASIVFDDPNLRRPGYGFIDYGRLLEHADAHDYHVAMATIPLDAGRPHRRAAGLFGARPDRLSLACHGNDHVHRELMAPPDAAQALAMAAQAMRRITRFERRWGLRVDRVMVPPHGMCSERTTAALATVGFDALCSIHPMPWTEQPPPEDVLTGWSPAQFVNGCAVVPRFPFATPADEVALRAFLDQPLVFYGHHEDLAEGFEPLEAAAALGRRLGVSRWCSLGEIAQTNHSLHLAGERAVVRPYARRMRVVLPAGATTLRVERPWDPGATAELSGWSVDGGPVHGFDQVLAAPAGRPVEVRLHGARDVAPAAVRPPAWRPWRRLRRAATEARDRALPLRPARAG